MALMVFDGGSIDRNEEAGGARRDQISYPLGPQETPVCDEHYFHSQIRSVLHNGAKLGMHRRLAARNHQVPDPLAMQDIQRINRPLARDINPIIAWQLVHGDISDSTPCIPAI